MHPARRLIGGMAISLLAMILSANGAKAQMPTGKEDTNSIGMRLVRVEPGAFFMGNQNPTPPEKLKGPSHLSQGDWDERPAHKVTISQAFYMSATEITVEQFRQFRPGHNGSAQDGPFVAGVTWHDAVAFCQWLSEKEGKPYRLPTEAEWEYACRAGAKTLFSSGDRPPEHGAANPWGLQNMHTGVPEWCLDWHGMYPDADRVDPVGPERSIARVVRGGGLQDAESPYYRRSANRAGLPPDCPGVPAPPNADRSALAAGKLAPGLVGAVFGEADLTRPLELAAMSQVHADWGDTRGKTWSARWRGLVEAPYTGDVEFRADADDGLRLIIAGETVIDGWGKGEFRSGRLNMVKGRKYPLLLEFFQNGGTAHLHLFWRWPGQRMEIVPPEALYHSAEHARAARADAAGAEGQRLTTHSIGFRVVQAAMPAIKPVSCERPFVQQCVKQSTAHAEQAPDPDKPYFRRRYLLPVPPENVSADAIEAAGLHPAFLGHNHCPALELGPNGDVLAVYYTSVGEYSPDVALMALRLRCGSERWDMPSLLFDIPDVNDHAPLLWNDNGTLHLFWGGPGLQGVPFRWCSSRDSGATWDAIKFPILTGMSGSYSPQPINSAFRGADGTMYVSSDAEGDSSLLWASRDNGKTWFDTGGRTGGRHTTFVMRKDGTILGLGGKNTDIDGFMPRSISRDGARTWGVTKTPFAALGSNQRPSVIRLASGRLFFASDFQHRDGHQPEGITERGAFVALSDDEGETWRIKKLPGALPHESPRHEAATIGYSAARQATNGVIHLVTSMNHPALHFEMNEAWILADDNESDQGMRVTRGAGKARRVLKQQEEYPNGTIRAAWRAETGRDGRYLLDGRETWYYENGRRQWEATYRDGHKVGTETYWGSDGTKRWSWQHRKRGTSVWTQWWPNGQKKSQSTWRDGKCVGTATRWDRSGRVLSRREFADGRLAE